MAKFLIHVGQGDERKSYEYDGLTKLLNVEVGAMQKACGIQSMRALQDALVDEYMPAWTSLVWVLRKRVEPHLQIEEVLFTYDDLSVVDVEDDEAPKGPAKKARKVSEDQSPTESS